ncbi:cation-transporting P-type ATPase [Actinopolymorpha sp. B17G11]|uniref:cation-translocating P-type ATPase n=1 Tax=Actinopolymorpha sp. B17G11 TaxID=3160861 RepID=UPI0032E4F659
MRSEGLSEAEAARRLEEVGPNLPPRPGRVSLVRRVVNQLRDPLIVVLIAAAVLTIVTADFADAAVILLVITVNTTVGVTQEVRADRAVEQLVALAAPAARVIRGGVEREVGIDTVVPGDLLILAEGEIVAADARLVEAVAFAADESMLTGEAVPVDKSAVPAGEPGGEVSAGTVVVRGRGRAVVTATGAGSAMGRVAALLAPVPGLTPLQKRLAGVARTLALAAAVLCLVVLVLGVVRGQPVELMVLTAVSLMVAAVPESLPAVVSLALALGARRMAARQAIVRRLPAVEALGSVTVIATDKTGTLTEGAMVVQKLWTVDGEADVTGLGYAPEGRVERDGMPLDPERAPDVAALLRACALCTDAALVPPRPPTPKGGRGGGDAAIESWTAAGDPTEAALLAAAAKVGLTRTALEREWPRVGEVPFDNARKRMTTVHREASGRFEVICKGAPEVLLRAPITSDDAATLQRAERRADEFARQGYRVLAVAAGERSSLPAAGGPSPGLLPEVEEGLRLLGLVAIADPPRASAAATIAACRQAGLTPVLITGDHRATARALAVQVGIGGDDPVVMDGSDLDPERVPDPRDCAVFARTSPEQKLGIVDAYGRRSQVVAMTGDGVNDAPALRRADIGVAMGRRGTEVAREAADLVLADDELATLVTAVEEGRRIYANVRRFLVYGLSGGAAEIMVMLVGPFLGLPLPLQPAQILWINLMTHGPPGVALGAEPAGADLMRSPPRPPAERILGAGLWQRIPRIAVVLAAVTLGVAVWAESTGRPWQSMAYLTLATTQLGVALGSRARPGTRDNPFLLVAVGASFVLMLAGLYVPLLRELLGTEPLAVADLGIVCVVSVAGYLAVRLDRRLHSEPSAKASTARGTGRKEHA